MFKNKDIEQLKNDLSSLSVRVSFLQQSDDVNGKVGGVNSDKIKELNEKVDLILSHLGLEFCAGHERTHTVKVEPKLHPRHNGRQGNRRGPGRPRKVNLDPKEEF